MKRGDTRESSVEKGNGEREGRDIQPQSHSTPRCS